MRTRAVEEIHKVKWYPTWGEERISGMVENRPDWCISRQRLWGVPITVLYCESCAEPVTSPELFEKVEATFAKEGADSWYDRSPNDFLPDGYGCAKCGGKEFRRETDILDVWFDSGCSHIAVLRTRPELTWPAALYVEGHDQHRGWFQSSLLVGTGIEGAAPYNSVVTCGFIVDESGDKMSKSSGKALSPQDVIKQSGADILRMWVASVDYSTDIPFGPQLLTRIGESYRKIRNTARYLLANLNDFDPSNAVPLDQLQPIDRWILARAVRVFERCRQAYDEYQFHVVYHRILDLCTVELSQVYLDISKDTVYIEAPDSPLRRSAQTAMHLILQGLVAYMAPIMSFTADEIYEAIPGMNAKSVHVTDFPEFEAMPDDTSWDAVFKLREEVTKVLERARAEKQIGQSLQADIVLFTDGKLANGADLAKIFIVSHVDTRPLSEASGEVIELEGLGKVSIGMTPARGKKCGRCWNYREEVANDGELCARCTDIVAGLSIGQTPTA